jgi:carbon storage regulator
MLVLSRRRDEVVKIGDDIEVMVVAIEGNQVRLGITAPADVKISRRDPQLDRDSSAVGQDSSLRKPS